jgi:hypothetical protein
MSRNCINIGDDIKNPRYDDLVQHLDDEPDARAGHHTAEIVQKMIGSSGSHAQASRTSASLQP